MPPAGRQLVVNQFEFVAELCRFCLIHWSRPKIENAIAPPTIIPLAVAQSIGLRWCSTLDNTELAVMPAIAPRNIGISFFSTAFMDVTRLIPN
jgi:hypothetical protein